MSDLPSWRVTAAVGGDLVMVLAGLGASWTTGALQVRSHWQPAHQIAHTLCSAVWLNSCLSAWYLVACQWCQPRPVKLILLESSAVAARCAHRRMLSVCWQECSAASSCMLCLLP
jgi:hypothetical protein